MMEELDFNKVKLNQKLFCWLKESFQLPYVTNVNSQCIEINHGQFKTFCKSHDCAISWCEAFRTSTKIVK